jgi:hypothetical protein
MRMICRLVNEISFRDRPAVIGMLLYEGHKDFVSKWSRLSVFRIRANGNVLVWQTAVELDRVRAFRSSALIVTKQRSGNAEQSVLHIDFSDLRGIDARGCVFLRLHDPLYEIMHDGLSLQWRSDRVRRA